MNLSTFNELYDKASRTKNAGDLVSAKKLYKMAGLELLKLALSAEDDELEAIMEKRAEAVIAYADSLDADAPKPREKTPQGKDAKNPAPENANSEDSKFMPSEVPDISFNDVAGLDGVKDTIRKRIIYPREHEDVYLRFKIDTGGGVLMYGPPGTGKTMIAKAIANEVNAKFFSIKGSDLLSKWYGEAEKNINALFERVRKEKTAVIFFDEFDSLAPTRGSGSSVMSRVVNELLSQIDGFSKSDTTLLLLAATNRPWDIDSAMVRSKRFSVKLYVPLPDVAARRYILQKCLDGVPIDAEIDFDEVAEKTEGFNGADVSEFCNRCKDFVLERCIRAKEEGRSIENEVITKSDVDNTLQNFASSVKEDDLVKLEKFRAENDVAD